MANVCVLHPRQGSPFSDSKSAGVERESLSLVPGDVVNLTASNLAVVPADMFLLCGDAIVNESMLTGESVPVSKVPVPDAVLAGWKDATDISSDASKAFLYSGTRVVRIRGQVGADDVPATALVVRTGFNTTKGALVRSMLFPKPMGFKFYRDSIRFILVLTGIAGLGFLASAVQFVRLGVPWHIIALRALDLITVVVPPALPATLSIGTSFALGRLRRAGVFCIAPSRVNVAGKVNVCCFDKTGTLTEDGLDVLGVRTTVAGRFGELVGDARDLPPAPAKQRAQFLHALATCHGLKMVAGAPIGDPLDAQMFAFTRWALEEGAVAGTGVIRERGGAPRPAALVQTVVRPPGGAGAFRVEDALRANERRAHFLELGVIRMFEFVSALRRMSVVVKRLKSSSMEVYVKGAPEVMADICDKDSCKRSRSGRGVLTDADGRTVPQDYDDMLSYYTRRGYRVIAIAGKSVEGLSWLKAQKMKR
jgi:cation-transporting ATPase 13A2